MMKHKEQMVIAGAIGTLGGIHTIMGIEREHRKECANNVNYTALGDVVEKLEKLLKDSQDEVDK